MEMKSLFESFISPVPEDPSKIDYEACKKCAKCGTTCCQYLPCYISPDDVKDKTFQGICDLIDTGAISLDWWCGIPTLSEEECMESPGAMEYRGYFLRMRGKNKPIVHPAVRLTECVMLDDKGCKLSYSYRPKGGRELIPSADRENVGCSEEAYNKQTCAIDWDPYHDILDQVYNKYSAVDSANKYMYDEDSKFDLGLSQMLDALALMSKYMQR